MHWYLQALKFGSDCLRELTFDTLKNVNTIKLAVDSTGAVDLPCDYVDWVKVGVPVGQYVQPLKQKGAINRLQNLDSTGQPINYPDDSVILSPFNYPYLNGVNGYWWGNGFSSNGQYLGKWYGFNSGNIQDGFGVFRERAQIQLDQYSGATYIILEYISDGQSSDSGTQIHPYAQKTIEAYVLWQFKEHNRTVGEGEKQRAQDQFSTQRRILRARLNDLSAADIIKIVRKSYKASIKG